MQPTPTPRHTNAARWQLQDAKAQFSALVREAQTVGPQFVSVHGKPAVVVVSAYEFARMQAVHTQSSFTALMRQSPWVEVDLDTARLRDTARDVDLGGLRWQSLPPRP